MARFEFPQTILADGWFVVSMVEEPPYYELNSVLIWAVEHVDTDDDGVRATESSVVPIAPGFNRSITENHVEFNDCLAIVHERDITLERRTRWTVRGHGLFERRQAWREKTKARVEEKNLKKQAKKKVSTETLAVGG
jgi:hypothetical protein